MCCCQGSVWGTQGARVSLQSFVSALTGCCRQCQHAGLMYSWVACCLSHTTRHTKRSSSALPAEMVRLLPSKSRIMMHKVTPCAHVPIKATLVAQGCRILVLSLCSWLRPWAGQMCRPRSCRSRGGDHTCLLTYSCWSLVSLEVKRTKAEKERRIFALPLVSRWPGPHKHMVPTVWAEVLGLLVMRTVEQGESLELLT